MSIQKSKGAYYTSPQMVRLLKSRIEDILENKNDLIILEPSAGEGAFWKNSSGNSLLCGDSGGSRTFKGGGKTF